MDEGEKTVPASVWFLCGAVLLYALAGSPTPDHPGWVEAGIGVMLVLSVAAAGIGRATRFGANAGMYIKALQVFFMCGLIVPVLSGVYFGNDRGLILRDMMAFGFLGLPLFLAESFRDNGRATLLITALLVFAGFAFAVRTLMPVFNMWVPAGELLYLSNSPLALLSGICLAGFAWKAAQSGTWKSWVRAALFTGGLGVIVAAMLLDVQRATVGAIFLSLAILAVCDLFVRPKKAFVPFVLVLILMAFIYPLIADAAGAMMRKTGEVGFNMRVQEARAVAGQIMDAPVPFFAGRGWGAVFSSPAVGGLEVNYTHSLLTTMMLKGGVALLIPCLLMVGAALYQIFLIFQQRKVEALALFWPLVIPVFLYASHKSFDFGLILLMIGVWGNGQAALQEADLSCKQKEHLST